MASLRRSTLHLLRPTPLTRRLHLSTPLSRPPYKDAMDRTSLQPKAQENTQSSTDDAAATVSEEAAFDPHKTSPEAERAAAGEAAGRKGETNPLETSGADRETAEAGRGAGNGGQEKGRVKGKEKSSGQGRGPKGGRVG
ncbi:hypothetical protein F4810DRAFT_210317 [Camillea tinctor]|nr:hypothetical protein F4810DRAFT_210317 [Camillea tinctor]